MTGCSLRFVTGPKTAPAQWVGEARLKMLKWLIYPFDPKAHGVRNPDGSTHYNAYLEGKMGNGTLDAVMDVDANGKVTGKIPLLKGVVLTFEGPVD